MNFEEKEKTALGPSVGADGGQSLRNVTNQSITGLQQNCNLDLEEEEDLEHLMQKMHQMSDPSYLPTITMNELFENCYVSRKPIIDQFLYQGVYIFAGSPKVGKSFFMAQLAYAISTGKPFWEYEVQQGTVLYLAMEDDYQRLQSRMSRMFGVEGTDQLFLAIHAKHLGAGLDEQLESFLQEHQDTRLIIIDTLQKIRESGGDAYSYANDYDIIGKLKQFADKHGICVVLVHHTRKQNSDDKFEMISGTTGLLGCADGGFLLHKEARTDRNAILEIVGRDQPDQRLYLVRDEETLVWKLDHAETEIWKKKPDPLLLQVHDFLSGERTCWRGSATDLVSELGVEMPPNMLTRKLNIISGELKEEYKITYQMRHTKYGSSIQLYRSEPEG